jgi:hypothetical protein
MRQVELSIPLIIAALCAAAPVAANAGFTEEWNDPVAGANNWFYYQDGALGQTHEGDVPMDWTGVNGSGYVSTELSQASDWNVTPGFVDRYFAYTWGQYYPIDLTVDPFVSVMLRATGDLNGADIRFWIGQWVDDDNYGFYAFATSLATGTDWTLNNIETNGSDWEKIVTKGNAPTVSDLMTNPEQWGFAIYGSQYALPMSLDLDWIRIGQQAVPLPATLLLLAPGLLLLRQRRRDGLDHHPGRRLANPA